MNAPPVSSDRLSEKVTQLRELVEQATPGSWQTESDPYGRLRGLWSANHRCDIDHEVEYGPEECNEAAVCEVHDPSDNRLIATAVNGFPALLDHCDEVLRRHQPEEHQGYVLEPGHEVEDWTGCAVCFADHWPCPEIQSVSRLLDSLITDKEGGNG